MNKCPRCSNENLKEDYKYCPICGIKLGTAQEVLVQNKSSETENLFKSILENAIKNNEIGFISKRLEISIQEVRNLRKGGHANINSDKLFNFISEYMANPKVIIQN